MSCNRVNPLLVLLLSLAVVPLATANEPAETPLEKSNRVLQELNAQFASIGDRRLPSSTRYRSHQPPFHHQTWLNSSAPHPPCQSMRPRMNCSYLSHFQCREKACCA